LLDIAHPTILEAIELVIPLIENVDGVIIANGDIDLRAKSFVCIRVRTPGIPWVTVLGNAVNLIGRGRAIEVEKGGIDGTTGLRGNASREGRLVEVPDVSVSRVVGIQSLKSLVRQFCDVDCAVAIDGDADRPAELSLLNAKFTDELQERAIWGDERQAVIVRERDQKIA
jgi:hypothetical protein